MSICATRLVFSRADQGLATSKSPCAASQTHPPPRLGEHIFPWKNSLALHPPLLSSLAPRKSIGNGFMVIPSCPKTNLSDFSHYKIPKNEESERPPWSATSFIH